MSGGCDRERSDEERALDRLRAEVRRLTAEIDRLRAENDSDRGMHEAQLASVAAERDHLKDRERSIIEACERVADGGQYRADIVSAIQTIRKQRDDAKTEIARLTADLTKLGALKSAEIAPIIDRFTAAFGVDVPQAPSGTTAIPDWYIERTKDWPPDQPQAAAARREPVGARLWHVVPDGVRALRGLRGGGVGPWERTQRARRGAGEEQGRARGQVRGGAARRGARDR